MTKPRKSLLPWFLALLLVAVGGLWFGWQYLISQSNSGQSDLPEDLIAKVGRRTIENRLLLTGEVAPAFSVEVKSEISGKVGAVHVRTGQVVKRGDPLITIDDTDLLTEKSAALTEIDGTKLEVDKRRGNYERAAALFEEKLISKEVYANLEADLLIAKNNMVKADAKLQAVEDKLSKTRILAPANGTVLNINVSEGQVVVGATSVNAGNVLMNFADLSRLIIQTHINQMDISKINTGDGLLIQMPGANSEPLPATVEFVAPVATVRNNIKGFAVEAAIATPDERLRPGMSVSMELPLGRSEQAVSVPIAAVFNGNDGERFVYVRQGGQPKKRLVTVGVANFSFAEITEGLEEGEEILLVQPRDLPEPS